jgi:hypothetical protein
MGVPAARNVYYSRTFAHAVIFGRVDPEKQALVQRAKEEANPSKLQSNHRKDDHV